MKVADVVCLITQAPIPGNDSLYAQMMVAYQQMVSSLPVPITVLVLSFAFSCLSCFLQIGIVIDEPHSLISYIFLVYYSYIVMKGHLVTKLLLQYQLL